MDIPVILQIQSQVVDTAHEAYLLQRVIELAKEAGYTHVQDTMAYNVVEDYTIDDALTKFTIIKPPEPCTMIIIDDIPD